MKHILGVILCGGESTRMGTDKGLMPVGDTIRARFMAHKLSFLKLPVVFSINKKQLGGYSVYVASEDLIIDDNEWKGPAGGLLTIHNRFTDVDILLLACDMLELDSFTILNLMQVYNTEPGYDYYVYQDAKFAQPFCGIYTATGLRKLKIHVVSKSPSNLSMQYVLDNGNTKRIAIQNREAFGNFNSPGNESA